MSRREMVLLVSRAIALLQITMALIDSFINLPEQALLLSQHIRLLKAFPGSHIPILPLTWVPIIFTLLRIAALWFLAVLFWKSGPTIQGLLLPAESQE
jgi:hypothetical protein